MKNIKQDNREIKIKYELPMFKDLGSQLDDLISKAHHIVEQQKEINSLLDKQNL